jgi:phage I-like protein
MQTRNRLTLFPALGAIAAAAALIACSDPQDPRTAGEQLDATVAKVEQKAEEAKADVKAAGEDAKQAVTQAADTVTDKARDATITAAVNAELAKDKDLSVLGINVDTSAGTGTGDTQRISAPVCRQNTATSFTTGKPQPAAWVVG